MLEVENPFFSPRQECLLKQEVQDVIGDLGCPYLPPVSTSHTLDSEKAQFAVSAVCAAAGAASLVTTQESRATAATVALETTATRASPIVFQNGGFQGKSRYVLDLFCP